MTWEELLAKALKQKDYFGSKGGVTISGGEPLLQAEALLPLFKALHKEGINTALDTNGFMWNKYVEELVNNTDYILLDIKHINPKKHKELTSVSIVPVLNFAEKMKHLKNHLWIRYVLVPEWNDSDEYLRTWAKYVKTLHAERIEVLPYHTLGVPKYREMHKEYKLTDIPTPSKELKEKTKKIFKEEGLSNIVIK
jgi:pyruvate formate lyase activating enzyme